MDLAKFTEVELLQFLVDILSKPGLPTKQDLVELYAINDEMKRRTQETKNDKPDRESEV